MSLSSLRTALLKGMVIPAHPLALTARRRLDERRQRALTRYYLAAGAGGVAVGVHTTQFEIHDPQSGLYAAVLELAKEEVQRLESPARPRTVKVAGLVGASTQALAEAEVARDLGYDCGLLSLGALRQASEDELIEHAGAVSEVLPLFGFYLQPAVGGRVLSHRFWRRFVEIERVVAIKIAPFNRYQTLDVVRAVAEEGREDEIALYTGNDDNIVGDLLTPFVFRIGPKRKRLRIVGGLLGQWAVWTRGAVNLLNDVKEALASDTVPLQLLARGVELTDANAALFDPQHDFAGCIPGIHEVLRRQGLLAGTWCLDPNLRLSPGQKEEIDRVVSSYPLLTDDDFVREHLHQWLAG